MQKKQKTKKTALINNLLCINHFLKSLMQYKTTSAFQCTACILLLWHFYNVTVACYTMRLYLDRQLDFVFAWILSSAVPFTLRASIWASCWQQCRQSGWSLLRLNSPSRSQELHSRLLEKPSSLHASDDSSAPYADTWRGQTEENVVTCPHLIWKRTGTKGVTDSKACN